MARSTRRNGRVRYWDDDEEISVQARAVLDVIAPGYGWSVADVVELMAKSIPGLVEERISEQTMEVLGELDIEGDSWLYKLVVDEVDRQVGKKRRQREGVQTRDVRGDGYEEEEDVPLIT
jgi:hypothetical protein